MSKTIRYRKATRERLVELFERIGYKVTDQSSDGTWKLLRLPDGTATNYWIFTDAIRHELPDNRGGSCLSFSDCYFAIDDNETVAIIVKGSKHNSTYAQFHNFKAHRSES
jgi:hypothetical protein